MIPFIWTWMRSNALWLILAACVLSFGTGIYVEKRFQLAREAAAVTTQLEKAQKGQNNIIKFHQDLGKTNVKNDPCFNTELPPDVRGLLK